jgi:hypothetical protein
MYLCILDVDGVVVFDHETRELKEEFSRIPECDY